MKTVLYHQSTHSLLLKSQDLKKRWRGVFLKRISHKNTKGCILSDLKHRNWEDFTEFNKNEQ